MRHNELTPDLLATWRTEAKRFPDYTANRLVAVIDELTALRNSRKDD